MARVTSKLQVTIPKAVATEYGIRPGDEIEFLPAGDAIRVQPAQTTRGPVGPDRRLELFDLATARQSGRQQADPRSEPGDRGWSREDLYERGRSS